MAWMLDTLRAAAAAAQALDARFLVPALVLQLATLGLRALAWRNVLAAAYPTRNVPVVGIAAAYVAGTALNAFLPARGGDAAKVLFARLRIPGATVAAVAASLSVLLVLDTLLGGVVIAALWATGQLPAGLPTPGIAPLAAAAALGAAIVLLARWWPERVRSLRDHLAQGGAVLRMPRRYFTTVVPLQLGAWACRIGVALFVLAAFRIDVGIGSAALVVVFNGLSTAVPVPGGVGTQQVLAAYALRGVAPVAAAVSFSVGLQVGITAVNTLVGLSALMLMLRIYRPVAAVRSGLALVRSSRH